jgi:CheY-like chemotaxis protein
VTGLGKLNMSILIEADTMDAVGAALSFPSREDFWVALTKLGVEAGLFLQGHTPSVVVYDDEMRGHFIKELNSTRATLEALRIKRAPEILDTLSEAVAQKDVASLSDGLRLFYAEMKILMQAISDAIVPEGAIQVKKQDMPVVMAIDDSPVALKMFSDFLTGHYLVLALPDGHSALKALERRTPDLFLIDLMMPGMSGYQLAKKIREIERFRDTPIIFSSSVESDVHERAALTQGGNAFIKKPFERDRLLDTVQAHITPP